MTSSPVARRAVSLREGRPTKDKVRALLAAGTVLGLGAIGTTAAWTDQGTATTGTFTLGTIDLKLNGNDSATLTTLNATAMKPGDTVSADLLVKNTGSVPFTYNFTSAATTQAGKTVGDALIVTVQLGLCASNVSTPLNGAGQNFTTATLTTSRSLTTGTGPAGEDNLCFRVKLPDGASSGLQGGTSAASFLFTATSS